MTVYSCGTPVNTHSATGSVTGTWGAGQFRAAGHLLVAVVTCAASTSVTATATVSGWTNRFEQPNSATANVRVAVWTTVAVGADAAPVFTSTETGTAGGMDCMLFELSGANTTAPIDTSGVYASGSSAGTVTMTATTAGNLGGSGEFALACFAQERAAAILTWTDTGTGVFSGLLSGNGVSTVLQTYIGVVNPDPGGVTLNDAGSFSTNTTAFGAGLVVAFAVAPATPAVNWTYANNAAGTVTAGGTSAPASGTSESWTVTAAQAFPLASSTAQPPVQFTVCDVAATSEKMLVTVAPGGTGAGQSWTVTRGTEGTATLSHTPGFAIVNVTTAGFLTSASQELSQTAYVNCDYTGVLDASAAFNAALASLPLNNGRSVGKIVFGPGNVKMAITPNNPGPCVYIEGAGNWATFIYSYVTGGDCFRVFDPTAYSVSDKTVNGGGITAMTIDGTNTAASSNGIHLGECTDYALDVVVQNFQGTGSKGVWFDNEYYWTEQLHGRLQTSGCTQCVVFDNPPSGASTSGSSFARMDLFIIVEQGVNGSGQVFGDGVVLQNGALITDSNLTIVGSYNTSLASTSAAVLRLIGTVPAGHLSAGRATVIENTRLHIGVEMDPLAGNTFAPMTIFSDGNGYMQMCYGSIDFGTGPGTFVASNLPASLMKACNLVVNGDNALGAAFQVFQTLQYQCISSPYTLGTGTGAQQLLNATAAGALAIRANSTFFFETMFTITGLSTSAHTVSFGFGGTATYTSCAWQAETTTAGAGGAVLLFTASSNAAAAITAAGVTTTTLTAMIKGVIRTNAAGTLIPQITNATNGIAAVVGANSYFRLTPVGSDTLQTAGFGNWT